MRFRHGLTIGPVSLARRFMHEQYDTCMDKAVCGLKKLVQQLPLRRAAAAVGRRGRFLGGYAVERSPTTNIPQIHSLCSAHT